MTSARLAVITMKVVAHDRGADHLHVDGKTIRTPELMLAGPFDELLWKGQILPLVTHDANAMKGADRW